jgi:murein DD-endopeptidase MepM/ murein hydrolase activator NlpD
MNVRLAALFALAFTTAVIATEPVPSIGVVLAHPLFAENHVCSEHPDGQLKSLGDSLGTDCYVQQMIEENGRTWMRPYKNDGRRNEDWFGWGVAVLSPCAGTVDKVRENPVTNEPGIMGKPPASWVAVKCADGVHFLVGHVSAPLVTVGDAVEAGQKIAHVGNNGMSRHPHIHLGAWKGETALQIRFDQTRMPIH